VSFEELQRDRRTGNVVYDIVIAVYSKQISSAQKREYIGEFTYMHLYTMSETDLAFLLVHRLYWYTRENIQLVTQILKSLVLYATDRNAG
jgi:hypothetical protein